MTRAHPAGPRRGRQGQHRAPARGPDPPGPAARLPGRGVPAAWPGGLARLAVGRRCRWRDGRLTLELAERAAARAGMATRLQRLALDAHRRGRPAGRAGAARTTAPACCSAAMPTAAQARVLLPETGQGSVHAVARRAGRALHRRDAVRAAAFPLRRAHRARRREGPRRCASGHWFWGALLEQRFVYRDVLLGRAADQPVRAGLPDVLDERLRPRGAEQRRRDAVGAGRSACVLVLGADLFMRLLRSHFVDEASARIDVQISATLMERVLGMRLEHRPESVGSFAANLRGFEQVRDFIASSTVTALIDLPFALLFVVVMAWISPWLAVPVVVAVRAHPGDGLGAAAPAARAVARPPGGRRAAQRHADREPDRHRDDQGPGRRERDAGALGARQRLPRRHRREACAALSSTAMYVHRAG